MEQLVSQPTSSNNSPTDKMKRAAPRKDYVLDHSSNSSPYSMMDRRVDISPPNRDRSPVSPDRPVDSYPRDRDRRVDSHPGHSTALNRNPISSLDSVSISGETKVNSTSPRRNEPGSDGIVENDRRHRGSSLYDRGYDDDGDHSRRSMDGRDRRYSRGDRRNNDFDRSYNVVDRDRYQQPGARNIDTGNRKYDDDISYRTGRRSADDDYDLNYKHYDSKNTRNTNAHPSYHPDHDRSYTRTFTEPFQLSDDSIHRSHSRRENLSLDNSLQFSLSTNSIKPMRRPDYSTTNSINSDVSLSSYTKLPGAGHASLSPDRGPHSPNDSSHAARGSGSVGNQQRVSAPSYMRPTTSQAIRLSQSTDVPKFDDFWLNPNLR